MPAGLGWVGDEEDPFAKFREPVEYVTFTFDIVHIKTMQEKALPPKVDSEYDKLIASTTGYLGNVNHEVTAKDLNISKGTTIEQIINIMILKMATGDFIKGVEIGNIVGSDKVEFAVDKITKTSDGFTINLTFTGKSIVYGLG